MTNEENRTGGVLSCVLPKARPLKSRGLALTRLIRAVAEPHSTSATGGPRCEREREGLIAQLDYILQEYGRPACVLELTTPQGSRSFLVPIKLEATAAKLVGRHERVLVTWRGDLPTPILISVKPLSAVSASGG